MRVGCNDVINEYSHYVIGFISELASKTISNIGRHLGQRLGVPPSDSI